MNATHPIRFGLALTTLIACLAMAGCSSGEPPEPPPAESGPADAAPADAMPGDVPVLLKGTISFTREESHAEGTPRHSLSYSRRFGLNCEFTQPAVTWKNNETGADEFQLSEPEPGVVSSRFTGSAQASGEAKVVDLDHEPRFLQDSLMRVGGPVTKCLIRQIDEAQFGEGQDMLIEFQASLTGAAETTTQNGDAIITEKNGGYATSSAVVKVESGPGVSYASVDDPGNIGMHLNPSAMFLRPALGPRPEGTGPEVELQQQVYDGLVAHPQTAWIGLRFDKEQRAWLFEDSKVRSGATDTVKIRIEVQPVQ